MYTYTYLSLLFMDPPRHHTTKRHENKLHQFVSVIKLIVVGVVVVVVEVVVGVVVVVVVVVVSVVVSAHRLAAPSRLATSSQSLPAVTEKDRGWWTTAATQACSHMGRIHW